jgi:hypothetical protein
MPPQDLHLPEELQPGLYPWTPDMDPLTLFHLEDGGAEALPFARVLEARFTPPDQLILTYDNALVTIKGTLAKKFQEKFVKQRATNLRIRGTEIRSIEVQRPPR